MKKRLVLFSVAISYLHGCSPAEMPGTTYLRRKAFHPALHGCSPAEMPGTTYLRRKAFHPALHGCSPAEMPGTTSVDASSIDAEGLEDVGVSATDAGTAPIDAGNTQADANPEATDSGGCVLPVRHSGDCACGSHMVCVRSCETVGTTAVAVAFCVDGGLP